MKPAVIIPTHDRPGLLPRAINSVLAQTRRPHEIIVVDDCPERPCEAPRGVKVVRTQGRLGCGGCREVGIASSRSDAFLYLDDDDEYLPRHVELLCGALERGDAFAFSRALFRHPGGIETEDPEPSNPGPKRYYDPDALLVQNVAPVSCFAHTRAAWRAAGGWDMSIRRLEDWDFWARMRLATGRPPGRVDEVTNVIHKDGGGVNMTTSSDLVYSLACSWRDVVAERIAHYRASGKVVLSPGEEVDGRLRLNRVGVVLPVYNAARTLRQALDSLLAQTYQDFEVLAVNDGSTDDSRAILGEYSARTGNKVRVFDVGSNGGVTQALNLGLLVSRSELIARMDADDVSMPRRFERQVAFLDENEDVGVVGSWFWSMDEGLARVVWDNRVESSPGDVAEAMGRYCCVGHPTVMMRRSVPERIGKYSTAPGHAAVEDYEFWTRAILSGVKVANVPEHLLMHRTSPGQVSSASAGLQRRNFEGVRAAYAASRAVGPSA